MSNSPASRRQFLHTATAAGVGFGLASIIPATCLGRDGAVAASNRIVMASIGTGGKGQHNTGVFLGDKDVQVVAVCDVDARHLAAAQKKVNDTYGNTDCKTYKDFREIVARQDIDAVCVSTPDHWHALTSAAAAASGKHVYCEKPLANSIGEGRAICNAVAKGQVVLQTGSHERSGPNARYACELVRNGRIGKLQTLRINLPCDDGHHKTARAFAGFPPAQMIPEGLDWDTWLGHTPKVDYSDKRCHFWWRFILAYGGGEMTDRGAHVIDLGQLGAGFDETGPVEIEAKGVQTKDCLYDAFWDYEFTNTYANGVKLIGSSAGPRGVKFEGSDGWIFIHVHGQKLEASKPELLQEKIAENEIQLGRTTGHHRNFLDAIQGKAPVMAPAEAGHRTASVCHLNNIAMRLGRPLKWDPKAERFLDDEEANGLITPKMRMPWSLA